MERKCRHVRRVKQYRYKREYRRRGGKVINVERRKISVGEWRKRKKKKKRRQVCNESGTAGKL